MTLFHAEQWRADPADPYMPPMGLPNMEDWPIILDGVVDHRPWYPDQLWNQGPTKRREFASGYINSTLMGGGAVWSVLRDGQLVGILLLRDVRPQMDAQCHFIFFDHELRSKRQLCRSAMEVAFKIFDLHSLRVEIPRYAKDLCGFVRKALGFKYEAERSLAKANLHLSPKELALLSRKASIRHEAVLYKGTWNDSYLLSVTAQEFQDFLHARPIDRTERSQHRTDSGTDRPDPELSESGPRTPERTTDQSVKSDQPPPAASGS